jgi:transaldolase
VTEPFHLYVDSATRSDIEAVLPNPLVYGVTTNPSLMRRAALSRAALPDFVDAALGRGARVVQVQVESADSPGILRDARASLDLASPGQIIPKIPATTAGFAAGSILSAEGVAVTYTAVFAPEQALFAAMAGAAYAAPYLGRLGGQGRDALALIGQMQAVIERYGPATRLLVASVRTKEAFRSLIDLGVGAITVPPRLLVELLEHPSTLDAERAFLADVEKTR